jgi:CheY-like chemotaxis protein
MMPKLNGINFVEQIHTLQPGTPVIFVTGFLSVISGRQYWTRWQSFFQNPLSLVFYDQLSNGCSTIQHHPDTLLSQRRPQIRRSIDASVQS